MAFPTVEAVQESPNLSGTEHVVDFPATVNAGDLLLLIHSNFNDFIEFQNDGSGWTELYDGAVGSSGRGQAWVKEAAGDEGGGTVTLSNEVNTTGTTGSAQMYRISGWSGTLTPGTAGIDHGTAGGTSDTPNPPSLSAPWGSDDNLWIAAGHAADDDASWDAAPTNYTNLFSTLSGGGGNNSGSTGSARRENATGTEDPGSFTLSQSEGWLATTFVIEPASGGGVSQTVGIAAETDTGLTAGSAKTAQAGIAGETDSGLTATAAKTDTVGIAAETDSGLAAGAAKTLQAGLASETDSALPATSGNVVPVGIATETDSGLSASGAKSLTAGIATESDAGLAAVAEKVYSLGLASETDSGLAATAEQTRQAGIATEADTGLPPSAAKALQVAIATETDTALAAMAAGAPLTLYTPHTMSGERLNRTMLAEAISRTMDAEDADRTMSGEG